MNNILKQTLKTAYRNCLIQTTYRCSSSGSSSGSGPSQSSQTTRDVPGLSKKVVDVPAYEVGFPKASKTAEYKNPEYFCYHNVSFFEAEVEMNKYRLPQPSNKVKN